LSKARQLCERAISEAVQQGEVSYIGYLYSTRGRIADDEGDVTSAIAFYRQAYDAYNAVGRHSECAVALHNIAQGYFDLKRYGAVRRTIATVMRLASKHKRERTQALAKTLLGEVEFAEGKRAEAMRHWTEAIDIAKRLNDKILQFRAEFPMYRAAVKLGDDTLARSLQRRLRRLSAWVPPDVGELLEFRELSSQPNRRPPE
jgi:tetratricopeptide (TPR) repeat protein